MTKALSRCFVVGFVCLSAVAFADRPRYEAKLADGSRVVGSKLVNWDAPATPPQLEDQPLLDPQKPLRWLRDRNHSPGPPPRAFVEMISGDRLPGEVIGFASGDDSAFDRLPPHLIVRANTPWRRPGLPEDDEPRVVLRFVRRIVWQKREQDRLQPNTVFYRDGSQTKFRSARVGPGFVNLLLDKGPRQSNFAEIAELHLPIENPWTAYVDEVALLSPRLQSRLLQLETTDGLIATASFERFVLHATSRPKEPDRWIHGLQPAWSLDVLWVPNRDVWVRRSFAPHEVPLSRIPPSRGEQRSLFGQSEREWKTNRNVLGGSLRNMRTEFGDGFGVHAPSELQFELPVGLCRGFRSQVGLDRAAGTGGCVRARVGLNATSPTPRSGTPEKMLSESGFLVGAEAIHDTGELPVDAPSPQTLVLQVDPADADRPAGADPLDVRDLADWFEPQLLLDPVRLQAEINLRLPRQSPAWSDWTPSLAENGEWHGANFVDELAGLRHGYLLGVSARQQPFTLRRKVTLTPSSRWLLLLATRPTGAATEPKLVVRVGDKTLGEPIVPLRNAANRTPAPISISLAGLSGEVELEIQQHPDAANSPVLWRGLSISKHTPTLFEFFEDAGQFRGEQPDLKATLIDTEKHSGLKSVKLPAGGQFELSAGQKVSIRKEPNWGEFRFLRCAFRKVGEGRVCLEFHHGKRREKPFRLDAGVGEPSYGVANRVWIQKLPNDWIVITRDLFTDFGQFELTGMTLSAPDGEHVLFDEIYLGRTELDFATLPIKPM